MIDFPVIDSHVHLWDPHRSRLSWLDQLQSINRPFGLADYFEHSAGVPVQGLVVVEAGMEAHYAFVEARQMTELARTDPRLAGIVAAAPLEYGPAARAYLEALAGLGPVIKGVRRLLQGESDPAYCLQPAFIAGVQMLPEFGFSFDLCLYHFQLPAVIELVKRCPATSFILDHIAKPAIKQHQLHPWQAHLRELAALPNVVCKISGMVTEADHRHHTPDDLAPYVAQALESFGEDRVLFGSDWPVALLASDYRGWVETLAALTTGLNRQAQQKLWAGNALRVYHLPADLL